MPSKSQAQHRLMQMAAAGKSDKVPKAVAQKYLRHDRGIDVRKLVNRKGRGKR